MGTLVVQRALAPAAHFARCPGETRAAYFLPKKDAMLFMPVVSILATLLFGAAFAGAARLKPAGSACRVNGERIGDNY